MDLPETDERHLAERYDESEFIVRNIIRRYGGWWTGRPSELKSALRETLATDIAGLCSGDEQLADHAVELVDEEPRLACYLADFALEVAADGEVIQEATQTVYQRRAEHEESLMATNL